MALPRTPSPTRPNRTTTQVYFRISAALWWERGAVAANDWAEGENRCLPSDGPRVGTSISHLNVGSSTFDGTAPHSSHSAALYGQGGAVAANVDQNR